MKINKKLLQLIAALWILVFHLWMTVSGSEAEQYLVKIGYVGVDIFFFTAAYSLADKKLEYVSFIRDRFLNVYLKFVLLTLIALIYKGWSITRGLKIVSGIEFFQKGGGAFLWFIPAIMIFYLVYPLFLKINSRYKTIGVLLGWLLISLILDKVPGYTEVFIFTNRIPVILAGYVLKKKDINKWVGILMVPIGFSLMYFFGYTKKLNIPFKDFYFVLAVVLTVGLAYVSGYIRSGKTITFLASATIEIYGFQMIFGAKLAGYFYRLTNVKILTNIFTILTIWTLSILCAKLFLLTKNVVNKTLKKV